MQPAPKDDIWSSLLRVTRAWRLEWNIDQLLGRVAREAVELCGAERGAIFVLERDGLNLRMSWPQNLADAAFNDYSRRIAQNVVQHGRPVFAHSVDVSGAAGDPSRSVLCVPLTASRG